MSETRPEDAPLKTTIENGKLIVSIGIDTLVFASKPENGGPLDDCKVMDGQADEWAHDVAAEIDREDEIGDTPIIRFLDEMMEAASANGSAALSFD